MSVSKVFVIGLDGATLDLVEPWAQAGYLPTFQKLIMGGACGQLSSTYPPLTGPAWCSFMTGRSPGRHGILEFFRRKEGSYQQILNNRLDVDGRSLWSLLSDAGQRVGVMGIPMTYPPEPVNGFMITGLLTPPGRRDFTYPQELLEELEGVLGEYRLRHDEKYRPNNPWPIIKEEEDVLENNLQAALYLIQHKAWDFLMVHLYCTDRIQHEFWHVLDRKHPLHNKEEREKLGNVILKFYQKVDEGLAKLLAALDEDTFVMIMSDHGFGPVNRFINLNTWLHQQGLLVLKKTPATRLRYLLFRLGMNYSRIGQLVLRLGLGKNAVEMGRARREQLQRRLFLSLDDVDWNRTKVYSIGNFGQLYVNLKGREPQGCVSPGAEYEYVLDDLARRLRAIQDPQTGEPVIDQIRCAGEIYQGPYLHLAPDLMFYTRRMEYKAMGLSDFSSPRVFDTVYGTTGHHRMNGVLICRHPGSVKEGKVVTGANIQDLAPTILYIFGNPIPADMDGKVLLDLFTPEFIENNPLKYTEKVEPAGGRSEPDNHKLTSQEEVELMDMLRSLGYVN